MEENDKINWSGYEWLTQERWGKIHKDKPWNWYDPSCVRTDNWGYLHLETHKNPTKIGRLKPEYGVGLISSVKDFGYGIFEIEAKLPTGKKLWPAFWMWSPSSNSWPPEIDIFEGYTDNRNGYLKFNRFNPLGWWNLPSNIWTHNNPDNGKAVNLKARTGYSGFKNPATNFIKYTCTWTEDYILIEHNNKVVRLIDDPNVLKHFNDKKMCVVINNHFQKDPPKEDNYSDFTIKYFNYVPL